MNRLFKTWSFSIAALALAAGALVSACDNAESIPESCQAIIDACHEVDPGSGRAHECHEAAHDDGTAAACDPIETECVSVCEALASDAGP